MTEGLNRQFADAAIVVILRVLRRKGWLKPAELTELRVALKESNQRGDYLQILTRLLDETALEREDRRDTPRKPG